jgi:hypothetical protein
MKRSMKLRAVAALDTMVRPQRLLAITKLYLLEGPLPRVGTGERPMAGWVPVLGEDDVLEERRDFVDDGDDFIAARDGELPAGAEIVLHVDDDEEVVMGDVHRAAYSSYL